MDHLWRASAAGAELHGGFSAAAQRLCEPKRQQPAPRRLCAGDSPQQARCWGQLGPWGFPKNGFPGKKHEENGTPQKFP